MTASELAIRFARLTPKKIHGVFPLLIMAVLYWLSSIPGTPLPDDPKLYSLFYGISPAAQNVLHVPAYAALGWAWHWVLGAWLRTARIRMICAVLLTSFYGAFDEWHQSFVPGRYASLIDLALDVAGAMVGIWVARRVESYLGRTALTADGSASRIESG